MSLANIPFFEVIKPVATPGSNTNSHEQPLEADNFFNILTAPENTLSESQLKAIGGHSPDAETGLNPETMQKPDTITQFLSQLKNFEALEQAEMLLNKAQEFGGLDKLVAEFEAELFTNPSSTFLSKAPSEDQNQKFEAFLSLISEFRNKVATNNSSDKQDLHISETGSDHLAYVKQDIPISETPTNHLAYVQGASTGSQPLDFPEISRTPAVVFPGGYEELGVKVKNTPRELTTPSNSMATLSSNHSQSQNSADFIETEMRELGELENERQTNQSPIFGQRLFSSDIPNGENIPKSQLTNEAQSSPNTVHKNLAENRTPKGASSSEFSDKLASLEQKPEGHPQSKPQSKPSFGKDGEIAAESKVHGPIKAVTNQNSTATSKISLEAERLKTFTADAFRLSSAELKGQKIRPSKIDTIGRRGKIADIDTIVSTFSRSLNVSFNPALQKDQAQKSQIDELSVEVMMPRSSTAQVNSLVTNSANSHSLEKLEKWLDSHLDLNSRGWVSNLSKSMLSALSRGQQRLTFMLSPQSLGRVNVSFFHGSNGLDVRINAERQATAALIGDAEAKLVSSIEVTGQRVSSLTCSSSNSFEQEYNSDQNASSSANRENSEKRNESQESETDSSIESAETVETIGKTIDDDTIINITI